MPTLTIGDKRVTVGEEFMQISPDQQHATVDEIAQQLGVGADAPDPAAIDPRERAAQVSAMPADQREQPSERAMRSPLDNQQTGAGAYTTWVEHAISDLPVIGPFIQKGSDILGTEVYGRLSGQDPAQMRADIDKRREARTDTYPLSSFSGGLGGNLACSAAPGPPRPGPKLSASMVPSCYRAL
jgi:hypothetical protein